MCVCLDDIWETGIQDYINFLCATSGITPRQVSASTGRLCPKTLGRSTDLNIPSITITNLQGTRVIPRTVKNISPKPETYTITWISPADVAVTVNPTSFTAGIGRLQLQQITFTLRATRASTATSFGLVTFTGHLGHSIHIPISILNKSLTWVWGFNNSTCYLPPQKQMGQKIDPPIKLALEMSRIAPVKSW